jgi:D-serine deaminase-like pyridoxal phosphate-dependent protein
LEMQGTDIPNAGPGGATKTLDALARPALLLDKDRLDRDLTRLSSRMAARGVVLRPRMKTAKSIDVARRAYRSELGPITVSTLAVAEYFARHGFRDMTYAVGLAPHTAERAMRLRKAGIDLKVLLDSPEQAAMLGVAGRIAGGAAENERAVAVAAAEVLRTAGHECPVVSVGSTPTAHFAEDLTGVTEMRAGGYMFLDLVMLGVGVCTTDDIAISLLATVIGTKPEKGWIGRSRLDGAVPRSRHYGAGRPRLRSRLRSLRQDLSRPASCAGQPGARHPRRQVRIGGGFAGYFDRREGQDPAQSRLRDGLATRTVQRCLRRE